MHVPNGCERAMDLSIRILIVGHSNTGRHLVGQLLEDFELEFTWQLAFSDSELRVMARQFGPHIVLFADESSSNSPHASLDTLRLLCPRRPAIFIAELGRRRLASERTPTSRCFSTTKRSRSAGRGCPRPMTCLRSRGKCRCWQISKMPSNGTR
jgi:hypothetical protein